ncbi:IclR family transcriptional regulator [Brevibacillus sp. TJ4]|uniref:IclR family transcriptional regulator n=1 Tax=Brevibacillus sp. TJ4 TaxID=3234853 RepID=UPI0037D03B77
MTERLIQSVDRAIDIIELFTASTPELSVKEISERLHLSKSTVHGLIKTLEYRGLLEQNLENQKYRLGLKLFELGNLVGNQLDIRKLSSTVIHKLVEQVKETVHLTILDKHEVVYVEKLEGPSSLRMYSQIGKRAPMYCTGVGKAILAYLDEQRVDDILRTTEMVSYTPYTITTVEGIKTELQRIRENGYATDDQEIELGLRCFAAPIFNHEGNAVASISCAGPINRIVYTKESEIAGYVKEAAAEISRKLGYRGNRHAGQA